MPFLQDLFSDVCQLCQVDIVDNLVSRDSTHNAATCITGNNLTDFLNVQIVMKNLTAEKKELFSNISKQSHILTSFSKDVNDLGKTDLVEHR